MVGVGSTCFIDKLKHIENAILKLSRIFFYLYQKASVVESYGPYICRPLFPNVLRNNILPHPDYFTMGVHLSAPSHKHLDPESCGIVPGFLHLSNHSCFSFQWDCVFIKYNWKLRFAGFIVYVMETLDMYLTFSNEATPFTSYRLCVADSLNLKLLIPSKFKWIALAVSQWNDWLSMAIYLFSDKPRHGIIEQVLFVTRIGARSNFSGTR